MQLRGLWSAWKGLLVWLVVFQPAGAITLDVNSEQSVKDAASTAVYAMMTYYHGNETGHIPGAFPTKWWEGSALFLSLLQYQSWTGDTTYNSELSLGLEWQAGAQGNYMPSNYSAYLGNDDQMFWGLAAMLAAELKFPDRPGQFSWLSLAQGVFNTQIRRWDMSTCGGGLRWQIWPYQPGYTMKNSISNGGLFQLAARLARYTNQDIYSQWAEKIWYWSCSSPLLNNQTWNVADSTQMSNNCATMGNIQWSYNYGTFMMGAAYMYNYTNGSTYWLGAVDGLMTQTFNHFFPQSNGGIFEEVTCEPREICNRNEVLFKGLVSTWLSFTALLVPSTYNTILPKLQTSATAAAASCTGYNNNTCGVRWYQSQYDGWIGMEEEISAADIFVSIMLPFINHPVKAPVTAATGGNSTGNPTAGLGGPNPTKQHLAAITTGDRAGAGILTAILVIGWCSLIGWMILGK